MEKAHSELAKKLVTGASRLCWSRHATGSATWSSCIPIPSRRSGTTWRCSKSGARLRATRDGQTRQALARCGLGPAVARGMMPGCRNESPERAGRRWVAAFLSFVPASFAERSRPLRLRPRLDAWFAGSPMTLARAERRRPREIVNSSHGRPAASSARRPAEGRESAAVVSIAATARSSWRLVQSWQRRRIAYASARAPGPRGQLSPRDAAGWCRPCRWALRGGDGSAEEVPDLSAPPTNCPVSCPGPSADSPFADPLGTVTDFAFASQCDDAIRPARLPDVLRVGEPRPAARGCGSSTRFAAGTARCARSVAPRPVPADPRGGCPLRQPSWIDRAAQAGWKWTIRARARKTRSARLTVLCSGACGSGGWTPKTAQRLCFPMWLKSRRPRRQGLAGCALGARTSLPSARGVAT